MSAHIVSTPVMTMVIKRLTDYTIKRLTGVINVPHLCVKVRHGDGYGWFGINILNVTDTNPWSNETRTEIEKSFIEAINLVVDLKEMLTEIPRLLYSIEDITTGRRNPIMFGNDSNKMMCITSTNNVQIELYRVAVNNESLTYGGFLYELANFGKDKDKKYGVFVYHRDIILYNYADEIEIGNLIAASINKAFPELSNVSLEDINFIQQVNRDRNRRRA